MGEATAPPRGHSLESLDNGFRSCADPAALQAACDAPGPADVQAFFDRWSHQRPWPMTADERTADYDHRPAICQLEAGLTQVFDQPVQGRHFFEAVIRENLDRDGLIACACSSRSN